MATLTPPTHLQGRREAQIRPSLLSYRGISLCSALSKIFEGVLISRLTEYTESNCTLTDNQLGVRQGRNAHDAIYSLLVIIQYNLHHRQRLCSLHRLYYGIPLCLPAQTPLPPL